MKQNGRLSAVGESSLKSFSPSIQPGLIFSPASIAVTDPTPSNLSSPAIAGTPAVASAVEPGSAVENRSAVELTNPGEPVADSGLGQAVGGAAADERSPAKRYFPLDPRSIRVEQMSGLLVFSVLLLAAIAGLVISFIAADRINWIWLTVAGGLGTAACVLLLFVLAWPAIEFRYARWTWDESGLEIHRGVLWQHRITIPISRIQHVDISQGPLQRQFGLGKVTVHTAGTQHAAIELSGIAYEAATWLREQIISGQGVQDAV
jgi:membrane protein YdbS with pleckstrin-like domain